MVSFLLNLADRLWRRYRAFAPRLQILILLIFIVSSVLLIMYTISLHHYIETDPRFCQSCHSMGDAWTAWKASAHSEVTCKACHKSTQKERIRQLYVTVTENPHEVRKHAEVSDEKCAKCHESGDPKFIQVMGTAGHNIHSVKEKIKCVTCHSVGIHKFTPASDTCLSCHNDILIRSQEMALNHCTTCHPFLVRGRGEQLVPTREECIKCHLTPVHEDVIFNFFDKNAVMRISCAVCHKPHERTLPEAQDCLRCHYVFGDLKPSDSRLVQGHSNCMSCHRPHLWTIKEPRETCLKCHGSAPETVIEHKIPVHPKNCTACHKPHTWKLKGSGNCGQCHVGKTVKASDFRSVPRKHTECLNCHTSSGWKFKGTKATCLKCHSKIHRGARPAEIPVKHKDCLNCHKPHTFRPERPSGLCMSCHKVETRQALSSKMRDCNDCHSTHKAEFLGMSTTCNTCHRPQYESVKGTAMSECNMCHQPHTWKATNETCTTCHGIPDAGTHKVEYHQDCNSCHGRHKWRPKERETCLTCHSDREEHFAGQSCITCHTFKS